MESATEEDLLNAVAEPAPAPVEVAQEPAPWVSWLRRPRLLGVLAGFVVLAVIAALALVGWQREASLATSRGDALDAGKRYALDLSTYDYNKIDENFRLVSQNSSPTFAKQYKEVIDQLTGIIKDFKGVSKGTVVEAGIATADTARTDVILFVDQEITNTQLKAPRTDRSRMKMTLVADGGAWKIDSLTLL